MGTGIRKVIDATDIVVLGDEQADLPLESDNGH